MVGSKRSGAYIWTFIGGFIALTAVMAVDIRIIEVLAATAGAALFIITGALWSEERIEAQYREVYNELEEYLR